MYEGKNSIHSLSFPDHCAMYGLIINGRADPFSSSPRTTGFCNIPDIFDRIPPFGTAASNSNARISVKSRALSLF
jgi:hypothetical protein